MEQLPRWLSGQNLQQVVPESDQQADLRIVAATSRDPTTAVSAHRLFEDLLCKLSEIVVRLPPLREHPEDIEPLAKRLLSNVRARRRLSGLHMTVETGAAIARLPWLGNIAELQKAIEIAAPNDGNECITPECLSRAMSTDQLDTIIEAPLRSLEEVERRHIMSVLAEAPTLADAAETLGINSSTRGANASSTKWMIRHRLGLERSLPTTFGGPTTVRAQLSFVLPFANTVKYLNLLALRGRLVEVAPVAPSRLAIHGRESRTDGVAYVAVPSRVQFPSSAINGLPTFSA